MNKTKNRFAHGSNDGHWKYVVTAMECDYKECFKASDINDALGKIGGNAAHFYNVYQDDVDSNVIIVANRDDLSEAQIMKLWKRGDLNLTCDTFMADTFDGLFDAIKDFEEKEL